MRIVCDGCGTRYSVPDERVSGRLCRFRCRKCGRVILLRGDLVEAERGSTAERRAEAGAETDAESEPPTGEATDPGVAPFAGGGVEAAEAFEATAPALTAQRSENSVLFSLDNLKALATSGATASAGTAQASVAAVSGRGFVASGEANPRRESSGLIDIRALAARELQATTPSGASEVAHFNAVPLASELPTFAPIPTVTAPIFAPAGMTGVERGMPRWAMALIGIGAAATITVGVAIGLIVHVNPVRPAAIAATTSPAPQPNTVGLPANPTAMPLLPPVTGNAATVGTATSQPPSSSAVAVATNTRPREHAGREQHATDGKTPRMPRTSPPTTGTTRTDTKTADTIATNDPPKTSDKTKRPPSGDLLDGLMDDATRNDRGQAPRPVTHTEEKVEADLPATLDAREVKSGMDALKPKVAACFAQFHVPGIALVAAQIAPSGHIQGASVQGALAGTPTAECVVKAVRGASFRRFKGSAISLSYPFVLR